MGVIFNLVLWPLKGLLSLLMLLLVPIIWTGNPFIRATMVVNAFIRKYIPLLGHFVSLFTECIWLPAFVMFWGVIYGYSLGYTISYFLEFYYYMNVKLFEFITAFPLFDWPVRILFEPIYWISYILTPVMHFTGGFASEAVNGNSGEVFIGLTFACWCWGWIKLVLIWIGHEWGFYDD